MRNQTIQTKKPGYCSLIGVSLVLLVPALNAHAYLDPGSGSFFLQMLLAAIAGAAFTIKMYWQRLLMFLQNLFGQGNAQKPEHSVDKSDLRDESKRVVTNKKSTDDVSSE